MSRYTEAQKREILQQARENIRATSTTSRTSTAPRQPSRSDQSKFKLVHKTYEPKDDDDSPVVAANGAAATRAVATASATYEGAWWQWVDEQIEDRYNFTIEVVGEAIGTSMRDLREPLEREDRALKRDIEVLRREIATLREEVRVERGLQDLHKEVARARREVPQLPALEERLRAEQNIARVDISAEQAQLRRELETTKRSVSVLRARHSNTDFNLAQFMRGMQNIQTSEIEYESASER